MDVLDLEGHKVLHIVDAAKSFQASRFLKNMSTQET